MKKSVSDVVRRGFDNVLSNWQLLLIRLAVGVIGLIAIVATVIAAIVPLVVTVVREVGLDREHPERIADALQLMFTEHWLLIAYLIALVFVVVTILTALHGFLEGASARVLIDAEAKGGGAAFDAERWFEAGRGTWWRIFWIYSIIGLAASVFVLVMLSILALLINLGDSLALVLSCVFGPILVFSLMACAIVAALWTQKSIILCVDRDLGARDATRIGWDELRADFSRHLAVGAIVCVTGFAAAAVLSSLSFGNVVLGHRTPLSVMFAPMQLISSFGQTAISAFVATWFTACFAAFRDDNRG